MLWMERSAVLHPYITAEKHTRCCEYVYMLRERYSIARWACIHRVRTLHGIIEFLKHSKRASNTTRWNRCFFSLFLLFNNKVECMEWRACAAKCFTWTEIYRVGTINTFVLNAECSDNTSATRYAIYTITWFVRLGRRRRLSYMCVFGTVCFGILVFSAWLPLLLLLLLLWCCSMWICCDRPLLAPSESAVYVCVRREKLLQTKMWWQ